MGWSQMQPVRMLTAEDVLPYLRDRQLVGDDPVHVQELAGGVSNVVFAVDGARPMVVKQSLPELRVATAWFAPQDRTLTEADAIELCSGLTPGRVPRLLHVDPERFVICLERAPHGWADWKHDLLAGHLNEGVAPTLGQVLATWHSATTEGRHTTARMAGPQAFELLRVEPYFRTVAAQAPDLAPDLSTVIEDLRMNRSCLAHGDLSPKNILTGPGPSDVCVIDFEVAHIGDPAFDVAFLISHLLLKSVHLPALSDRLDDAVCRFVAAYSQQVSREVPIAPNRTLRYVGALLLARVLGKSPAEYLSPSGRQHAWSLGTTLLRDPVPSVTLLPDLRRSTTP